MSNGKYYYAPHRSLWGIWKRGEIVNGAQGNDFIRDFATRDEAVLETYRLNGWKLPKGKIAKMNNK